MIELVKIILLKLMIPGNLKYLIKIMFIINFVGNSGYKMISIKKIPPNPNILNFPNIKEIFSKIR